MQNYALFTDTDTDITPEIAKEYGYHVISMPYCLDGKTIYPYEDFEVFDAKPFYDMLREGVMPTTSSISEDKYRGYFEPVLAAGQDILYLHFSRALSATFEIMDRVGGGDSFASGLIYGLMTTGDAEIAVNYGAAHGALAMTTPGDTTMASKKEVEAIMGGAGARVQR